MLGRCEVCSQILCEKCLGNDHCPDTRHGKHVPESEDREPIFPRPAGLKEGDEVVETEKGVHLFVVSIGKQQVGMAYSRGGTMAVGASYQDFTIFFEKVTNPKEKKKEGRP